jgi:hypothetical protein
VTTTITPIKMMKKMTMMTISTRKARTDGRTDSTGDIAFEDDIDMLRDYLFVSVAPGGVIFEMHRLVQLAARKWVESQGQH